LPSCVTVGFQIGIGARVSPTGRHGGSAGIAQSSTRGGAFFAKTGSRSAKTAMLAAAKSLLIAKGHLHIRRRVPDSTRQAYKNKARTWCQGKPAGGVG